MNQTTAVFSCLQVLLRLRDASHPGEDVPRDVVTLDPGSLVALFTIQERSHVLTITRHTHSFSATRGRVLVDPRARGSFQMEEKTQRRGSKRRVRN